MKLHRLNMMLAAALLTISVQVNANSCDLFFGHKFTNSNHLKQHTRDKAKTDIAKAEDGAKASVALYEYLKKSTSNLLKTEDLADIFFLSMLTKENILLLGPLGTAKSIISTEILSNIKEKPTNDNSFVNIQWNFEINSGDTIGKEYPGPRAIAFKTALIDEIFDVPPVAEPNTNILEAISKSKSTSGAETNWDKLEFVVGTTNMFLSEVFRRASIVVDRSEVPQAILDRFGFKVYLSKEFVNITSDISLNREGKVSPKPKVDNIYFEDIYAARELMQQVKVPVHVTSFLSEMRMRIHEAQKILEEKSVIDYNIKRRQGKGGLEPPYRRTTYPSALTLPKIIKNLQAQVVLEYVKAGGNRPLEVSLADVKPLAVDYGIKGLGSIEQIEGLYDRAVFSDERSQLSTILNEYRIFETIYNQLLSE